MSDKFERYYIRILIVFTIVGVIGLAVGAYLYWILGQTAMGGIFLGIALFGALLPGVVFMVGGSIYLTIRASRRVKEKEQERSEAIVKEVEDLGEKVLGCIRVVRRGYGVGINEVLVITPSGVIVAGIAETGPTSDAGGPPYISWSDVRIDIPRSEITKVELDKFVKLIKLDIITREEEYKWYPKGLIPEQKDVKLEDYENILRQAFPDKLSVKK